MTDNTDEQEPEMTDDRPRSQWVNVHEQKLITEIDGTPDGMITVTTSEVLVSIDWPAAIQRQSEGNTDER